MGWTYAALASAFRAISPAPASLSAAVAALNAQTSAVTADTNGSAVRGVLYVRAPSGAPSSFERVLSVAEGVTGAPAITAPSGYTAAEIVTLCQALGVIMSANDPIPMSQSAVSAKIKSDLSVLMAAKLADGKGILWAPGELASGDPGDQAVLLAQLVNATVPVWQPAIAIADLQSCQTQGLISNAAAVS